MVSLMENGEEGLVITLLKNREEGLEILSRTHSPLLDGACKM